MFCSPAAALLSLGLSIERRNFTQQKLLSQVESGKIAKLNIV